jgi:proteasome ATPase
MPVIVFFDEMDSLFRTRGSGVSSDVENTIVPQLLSEIDGVEGLDNVIIIGASNREDMIDPAILRPGPAGRQDQDRAPDAEAAREIFSKYLTSTLPLHHEDLGEFDGDRQATVRGMIDRTVERMYEESEENQFLEVTYAGGDKEVLYFKDFNSGAMIQNIVDRAKKTAIKDLLDTGVKGHPDRSPAAGLHRRVRRERGPAQHDQPGRLGQDQRQEGRADRVHPDADQLEEGQPPGSFHRHGLQHRAVLVGPSSARSPCDQRSSQLPVGAASLFDRVDLAAGSVCASV